MIRVLIVDGSEIMRRELAEHLGQLSDIQVVAVAEDPYDARDLIVQLRPDVITLDLDVPRMDSLAFLARLMKYLPMPVVMLGALTRANGARAVRALELGAIDVIATGDDPASAAGLGRRVASVIRAAAGSHPRAGASAARRGVVGPVPAPVAASGPSDTILALGASMGGTIALETVLTALPAAIPGTVVVQHMPEHFTSALAQRLDSLCAMEVREASDGEAIRAGVVLIAPGNRHLTIQRNGTGFVARVKDGPAVHFQRPAVDVLFESVAKNAGSRAVGVLLTGMGADGARGLLAMKQAGARTLAQDEATSIVFGMPKEAIAAGAVDEIVPLPLVASTILRVLRESDRSRSSK